MVKFFLHVSFIQALLSCSQPETVVNSKSMSNQINIFTNSIGMEFILVEAGNFQMGAGENDSDAFYFEKPQHEVKISKPFMLAKFEITQAEWEEVMGFNPFTLDRSNPYYNLPGMKERITKPDHPATVSWNDAQEFTKKLNEKEGHNRYRLPTEAEWEITCRAGTTTAYSFGNKIVDLEKYAWYGEDFTNGGSHPVGQKLPNSWGFYDMHGNAWEWVSDWFDKDYYTKSLSIDPKGPESGSQHVVKGGSWHQTSTSWRSSFKKGYAPDYRGISIGFRIVMEVN